jgi:hypothetical protein
MIGKQQHAATADKASLADSTAATMTTAAGSVTPPFASSCGIFGTE